MSPKRRNWLATNAAEDRELDKHQREMAAYFLRAALAAEPAPATPVKAKPAKRSVPAPAAAGSGFTASAGTEPSSIPQKPWQQLKRRADVDPNGWAKAAQRGEQRRRTTSRMSGRR